MSFKTQFNNKYWNDSKQIFFTPKLSLEGRNLFPQINQQYSGHPNRDQPFLNILKKPIMSLYDRTSIKSQKKPVCIVGMPKEVEIRHVRTGHMKKTRHQMIEANFKKETFATFSPILTKTQTQILSSPSKQLAPIIAPPEGTHCYVLGPGNNRQIVEQVLKKRQGWQATGSSIFHLKWEQARPKFQNISAPHRQVINHLPGHEVISDKGNLLAQLKTYCQKNEEYMYKIVPASFIFDFKGEDIEQELKKFITFFYDCNGKAQINPEKEEEELKSSKMTVKKRGTNEFNSSIVESPKKIVKGSKYSPVKSSKFKNQMFSSPEHKRKQDIKHLYRALINHLKPFHSFQDMSAPKKQSPWVTSQALSIYGDSSLWLLKPSDLNRGRGIKLFRTVEELAEMLKDELKRHEQGSFIVQKYIERPLLLGGRKFDIRVWTLVTHTRELYFFKQGYIRLTSEPYSLESSSLLTHLTNSAVQKHGTKYGQFQEGNILPISYLYQQGYMEKDWLFSEMKRKIVSSMKAAGSKLYQPSQKHQSISVGNINSSKQSQPKIKYFQIFGYDFMVDGSNELWLIEVNTNPSLELSNKWLATIIPRMLDDCFKLTLDRLFTRKNPKQASDYHVDGYEDTCNMWDLLDMNSTQILATMS